MTTTTDPRFVGATAPAAPRAIAPPPPDTTAETDAVEGAYLAQLQDLYRNLVINLTTGDATGAAVRFEHGVEFARQARAIALQAIAP